MTAGTSAIEAGLPARIGWLWPSLAGLATLALAIQLAIPLNHDVAFTMISAERLLDGGRYGVEVVDPNLPLAYWLAVIPAALARLTGLGLGAAAILFALAAALSALALASSVLRHGAIEEQPRHALVLLAGAVLLIAPGVDFGQREHLMLIGGLPWVLAAGAAARGAPIPIGLRVALGVAAGLAFSLKPHFLFVPILVEAWLLTHGRKFSTIFRAENLALAATGLVVALAIVLAAPAYLRTIVPDASAVYWAFDSRPDFLLRLSPLLLPFVTAAILARQEIRFPHPIANAMLAASVGALLAALLQFKGWDYHWLPMIGFAAIACAAAYCTSFAWGTLSGRTAAAAALVIAGAFWGLTADVREVYRRGGDADQVEALTSAPAEEGPGRSVFAFITSPRAVHPAIIGSGARWSAAACCLQWVAADFRAAEAPDPARARQVARAKKAALLRTLEQDRPDIILVDDRPFKLGFAGQRFDYLDYLRADPGFRSLLKGYREQKRVAGYRLFVRARG